jgi:hypothetical protein
MAVAEVVGGSQTATISTEHTLATSTTGKTYCLVVDTTNMVNGDVLELRIKTKPRTGGTSTLAYIATYANIQTAPVKYSVPIPANVEIVCTLKQTAGTGRVFIWALLSID